MNKAELEYILQEGEGYCIEFKESVANLDKEICAFANASGGKIYIGITDDRQVKGIAVTNRLKSQIQDIARNIDPPVLIMMEEFENILIVEVRESQNKPCRTSGGFFNRIGPNSQKMNRDEIIEFAKMEGKVRFDEVICRDFAGEDFDPDKLGRFLKMAGISKVLDTPHILKNLHVAEIQEGKLLYFNTAVLFFAKNLADYYFHTTVTCALFKGTDKAVVLDRKDFNKDIIFNIDEAMLFLKQHLKVRYEFDGSPAHKEIPEIPFEALREALINAVIHRDYFIKGANVMVEIFDNKVEITSPGGLPKGLKEEEFGSRSLLRNPNIANLMQRIDYIEKMGTGIKRIEKMMREAGLPPVKYGFSEFVSIIFKRAASELEGRVGEKVGEKVGDRVGENLSANQLKIVEILRSDPYLSAKSLSEHIKISLRKVENNLAKLQKKGLIRHVGSARGGYWEIVNK